MGIVDKVTALLPWRGERREPPPARSDALTLRDGLDRWLQRLVEEPRGFPALSALGWTPSADVPLPPGLDLDRAEARVRHGVLTVRFPKAAGRPGARRIPIKT